MAFEVNHVAVLVVLALTVSARLLAITLHVVCSLWRSWLLLALLATKVLAVGVAGCQIS